MAPLPVVPITTKFNASNNTSMRLSNNTFLLITLFSAVFFLFGCGDNPNRFQVTYNPPAPFDTSESNIDSSYTTDDGLQIYIVEEGDGLYEVVPRDRVSIFYTGRTIENGEIGRVFDSTYRNGSEAPGVLGNLTPAPNPNSQSSPLIDGFRRAIIGMRAGGRVVAIIPPSLGYGGAQEGSSGYSLRNDTLRFDIELEGIL